MKQIILASVVIFIITTEITSVWSNGARTSQNNIVYGISRHCKSPDSAESMSAEALQEDADNGTKISEFDAHPPQINTLGVLEHITGSDVMNVLNKDDYRENSCRGFATIEPALGSYLHNRATCFNRRFYEALALPAFYRTLCKDDFEENLTDILRAVGDECLDSLFQIIRGKLRPHPEDIQTCRISSEKLFRASYTNISEFKENFLQPFIKACILTHVVRTCGTGAADQFQLLTDDLLTSLFI